MPTYDLDDLCQQDSIGDVLAQVLDEAWTARLGQVVIGPVCVNLQQQNKRPVSVCETNTVRCYFFSFFPFYFDCNRHHNVAWMITECELIRVRK